MIISRYLIGMVSLYLLIISLYLLIVVTCDGVPVNTRLDCSHLHTVHRDLKEFIISAGGGGERNQRVALSHSTAWKQSILWVE